MPLLIFSSAPLLIIVIEYAMWILFRRKMQGLILPSESDQPFCRFFSFPRLRALAILHALTLTIVVETFLITLW